MNEKTKNIIFITILVVLLGLISFGVGRLSTKDNKKTPITVDYSEDFEVDKSLQTSGVIISPKLEEVSQTYSDGLVVASKNSDKYHFPWCSGAKRIKEENKIYFPSIKEAREAGYLPAGNCKGLN